MLSRGTDWKAVGFDEQSSDVKPSSLALRLDKEFIKTNANMLINLQHV